MPAAPLEFRTLEEDPTTAILAASARLNSESATPLLEELDRLLEAGVRHVIVDCSALDHVSSAGVGTLVRAQRRVLAKKGQLKLAAVNKMVVRILELTHLVTLFPSYPTIEDARNS